jgi:hypothetical protein
MLVHRSIAIRLKSGIKGPLKRKGQPRRPLSRCASRFILHQCGLLARTEKV